MKNVNGLNEREVMFNRYGYAGERPYTYTDEEIDEACAELEVSDEWTNDDWELFFCGPKSKKKEPLDNSDLPF